MPNECHSLNVCEKISKQNFYTNFWYFYIKKRNLKKKNLKFYRKKFNNWTQTIYEHSVVLDQK